MHHHRKFGEADVLFCRALLATVRQNGDHPCPRCFVEKLEIHKLGQVRDMEGHFSWMRSYIGDIIKRARTFIYELGLNVAGAAVERLLSAQSWVPTVVCIDCTYLLSNSSSY